MNSATKIAVIGSGMYAMATINAFADAVALRLVEVVWILPNENGLASIFDGHGWNQSASSITFDPTQTSLPVAAVICGTVEAVRRLDVGHQQIFVAGRVVCSDAIVVALDPYQDMSSPGDAFLGAYRPMRPADENSRLKNVANLQLNLLCKWHMERLSELLTRTVHRKYIQSSIQTRPMKTASDAGPKRVQDADEETEGVDDDDDMEFDRPTVLHLTLPLATTAFATALMQSSSSNSPELIFFAMNEGERVLRLRGLHMDDGELQRICDALRHHYVVPAEGGAVMMRDVSHIDVADNKITTLCKITDTFVSTGSLTIRSMLRHIDVSNNPLEKSSVVGFLDALVAGGDQVQLASLKLRSCGLDDNVGDVLCAVVSRMSSLTTLDVGDNPFTPTTSAKILQSARHHLTTLSMTGINLCGCDVHLQRLFSSELIEHIDLSRCSLNDASTLSIGEALVRSPARRLLRVLRLTENSSISTEGVCFLFQCLTAIGSEFCRLSELNVMGCGPVGVDEIAAVATLVHHCKQLSSLSLSVIEEEQLCLQVVVDAAVKYASALVDLNYEFVACPSRCDTSVAVAVHAPLPQNTLTALQQRLCGNRERRSARQEQLAGRSLTVATVIDLGAEAARSVPCASGIGVPTHYVRIDDSLNHASYSNQSTSDAIDAYRHQRWEEALRQAVGQTARVEAGYSCGSIDTVDHQYDFFCDATVFVSTTALVPSFMRDAPTYADGTITVDDHCMADASRRMFMIGCGARSHRSDAPFPLSANCGVHAALFATIVIPNLRGHVIALLLPKIAVPIPRTDVVGMLMGNMTMPPHVLRQKLLEALALPYASLDHYMQLKQLKVVLDEVCHRLDEAQPPPYVAPSALLQNQGDLRGALERRGIVLASTIEEPPAKPPATAATGPPKESKKEASPPPVAAPVTAAPPLPSVVEKPVVRDTRTVLIESLGGMLSLDLVMPSRRR